LHAGYRKWTHMGSTQRPAVLTLSGWGDADFHEAVNFAFTAF
jgi:hypothetical protein